MLIQGHARVAERDGEMHVLDLGNNSISREGASALAAYMKKSSGLKELNLYMNDIGTAGITQVCSLDSLRGPYLQCKHAQQRDGPEIKVCLDLHLFVTYPLHDMWLAERRA